MNINNLSYFVEKANKIHNKMYDYSQTRYTRSKTLVTILCRLHGPFYQSPNSHLRGRGCPKCGKKKASFKLTTSLDEFIQRSKKVHGDKYSYSKSVYINSKTNLVINCPLHGDFLQSPIRHLKGNGCRKCGRIICGKKSSKKIHDFIKQASDLHQYKYSYKNSIYKNALTKIEIYCPKHGVFHQKPNDHLSGHGCPTCVHRISHNEKEFLDYYSIPNTINGRQVKILNKRVDGYDQKTNTIYEFLGDYWHGNPEKYNPNEINARTKTTFSELFRNTLQKFKVIKDFGYNVNFMWESNWKKFKTGIDKVPKLMIYS